MVRYLKSFIRKYVQNGQEMVAIEQKIEEWKCANPGDTPIIAIDFPGFYRLLCNTKQGQLDVLFGNQENSLNVIESVLQRFVNMGVQLELFCGGSSKFIKNPELANKWSRSSFHDIRNAINDVIKRENSPEAIIQILGQPIYNNSGYFMAALMLAEKYGNLHKSYHNECERDIALHAKCHSVVAIMSADFEFILVDNNGPNGRWKFWDLADFNPTTFQIMEIDQFELQNALALSEYELQIFGVLFGNNFKDDLMNKFPANLGFNPKFPFKAAANFIRKKFRTPGLVVPVEIATAISQFNLEYNAQIAEKALMFFANVQNLDIVNDNEISAAAKRIHHSYAYQYLNDLVFTVQSHYWPQESFKSFMEWALLIHRCQMGVVLQHKEPGQVGNVICIYATYTKRQTVEPEYPPMEVPSLIDLYNKDNDEDLLQTKLKLLCWIASKCDQLNYKSIENIPKSYLCAALVLNYLVEIPFISSVEADFFLYCLHQYDLNPQAINSLSHPNTISEYPFSLVFLYDKFYQFMAMSMNTVGLSEWVVRNQLNGVYFHTNFERFINLSEAERDDLLHGVNEYRLYLNR